MGIDFLFNLLGTLPGTVVYHLLIALSLLAAWGIVWIEWRQTHNEELRPYVVALTGTIAIHLLSVLLAPFHVEGQSALAFFTAPLLYAGNTLALALLVWAFGVEHWRERPRIWLRGILMLWAILLLGASLLWYRQAFGLPMDYTTHSWQVPFWYGLNILLALAGATVRWRARNHGRLPFALIAFLILAVANLTGLLGSRWLGGILLAGEGIGRLIVMLGYPLFAVELYQTSLQDLQSYRKELQDLSQEALRQSQSLLFLIEATRSIGEALDLRGMLGRVAESVAMALSADRVAIFVTHEERQDVLLLTAQSQLLGMTYDRPREVELKSYPSLAVALRQRQLVFGPQDDLKRLHGLFSLLGVKGVAPVLIQPLTRQKRTMGVLVACNDHAQTPFSLEQQKLATTIAVQIAGAVENSRLYQQVQTKARELRSLLKVREQELHRQEAILESMAEGILVTDDEGKIILMNKAAEAIFAMSRDDLLDRNLVEMMHDAFYESAIAPERLVALTEPLETILDLHESKIRVHAAPVRMGDGARLGVVAVLQDITREMLAEEAKRDFITSISHELRTPLTAIKGYVELMLSGMAGSLPEGLKQFLGVIRENAVRMNFISNNLISVAEIERGRLGLSYKMTEVPPLLDEVLVRYSERITERQLLIQKEIPEDLPQVEVDPNRVRLILDNLISNAVKFTHPKGEITITMQTLEDELGETDYISLAVADTGVGISPEEQGQIWERFYRADSPLSLEAGGLGIGLAIVQALVEAHCGRVWVESTPGVGSVFTVLLPTQRAHALEMESAAGEPD